MLVFLYNNNNELEVNMKKLLIILMTITSMIIMTNNVFAGEFGSTTNKKGERVWIYYENNLPVSNRWVQNHEGKWYYCGEDGYLLKDTWLHDSTDGKYYYLGSDWAMLHDTTTPDGYTVESDGAWVKDGKVVVETVTVK